MCLAEDLKSVADAPHEPTGICKFDDRLHQWRKPRDSAGAQVVSVGEAAGQDDAVGTVQIAVFVPEHHRIIPADFDRVGAIAIGPCTREDRDTEPHHGPVSWWVGRARITRGTGSGRLWRPRPSALARGTTRAPRWPRSTLALPTLQRLMFRRSPS